MHSREFVDRVEAAGDSGLTEGDTTYWVKRFRGQRYLMLSKSLDWMYPPREFEEGSFDPGPYDPWDWDR
jgi:hypothetical protein